MSTFDKNNEDPLKNVRIETADKAHISIKDNQVCIDTCENKPCTYYCPSRVFSWSGEKNKIKVDYKRCIECGACPWGCPYDNIYWEFPPGGYGVVYNI
ncbi:MAG: ferredoxin family protein [Halanaerobiales bacterium]